MKQQFDYSEWNNQHFFASSIAEWKVHKEIEFLIKYMKKHKQPFNLYFVPLPEEAPYQIKDFAPVVEGVVFLGYWE